jgi:hypothetical protein
MGLNRKIIRYLAADKASIEGKFTLVLTLKCFDTCFYPYKFLVWSLSREIHFNFMEKCLCLIWVVRNTVYQILESLNNEEYLHGNTLG